FPHESTADQFFDESQFESYRALGRMAVEDLLVEDLLKGRRRGILDVALPTEEELRRPAPLRAPRAPVASVRSPDTTDGVVHRVPGVLGGAPAVAGALAASVVLTVTGTVTLLTPNKLAVEALKVAALDFSQDTKKLLDRGLPLTVAGSKEDPQP